MSHWPNVKIEKCCRIVSGATPGTSVSDYWDGEICWVTPKDLSGLNSSYIHDTPRKITKRGIESCSAEILPVRSVLFSSRAPIGHVAINSVPMATNQGFKSFIPDSTMIYPEYLFYWLKYNRSYLEGLGNGATFKEVSKAVVARIELPLPSLIEQKRIAAILDAAEALREKRRQAIAKLDALVQAVFLEMFGDAETIIWPIRTIAEIVHPSPGSIRTGPFGSQLLHGEFVDKGVAVLGIDNAVANEFVWSERRFITETKYRELKRYTVKPGDVLITIMGTCGRCAIVPDNIPIAINTKHLCCITLDREKCLPAYLHSYFLLHPLAQRYLNQSSKGAIMAGLNMGLIKAMPIPIPPIDKQREYVQQITAMEKLKIALHASLTKMETLFTSLQQRAFRGNCDLV